jgi:DNA mismatch repair protein MutS
MAKRTPVMQQYDRLREQAGDAILFFRLGDFYELFGEQAALAAGLLSITLTSRDKNAPEEEREPMCGVPYHAAEGYIAKLIALGHKVAVAEQMQDPATVKGLVDREIVRIVTPGTLTSASMLEENRPNYLGALYAGETDAGLCFADLSTGEVYATTLSGADLTGALKAELDAFQPRELLFGGMGGSLQTRLSLLLEGTPGLTRDPSLFNEDNAVDAVMAYLQRTRNITRDHMRAPVAYKPERFLEFDANARRHLELTDSPFGPGRTLLSVLDFTGGAMGARTLRRWLDRPLRDITPLTRRHDAVDLLAGDTMRRGELMRLTRKLPDMERLLGRLVVGEAVPRDLLALAEAAERTPGIRELLLAEAGSTRPLLATLHTEIGDLSDVADEIRTTLDTNPAPTLRDGGFIRPGFHAEVDRLRDIVKNGQGYIARLESGERERTGIKSLKVGYNKVFGYYVEITKSYYDLVPDSYIRKQTLAGCERYVTAELKELESTILSARDNLAGLERDLFGFLTMGLIEKAGRLRRTAAALGELDAICSLAEAAVRHRYVRPALEASRVLDIKEGRHPVVERHLQGEPFVPNDVYLDGAAPVAILTGPNMAGKSTYMRQAALMVVMAQAGSFVPAASARIGLVDRVFTRIGASDDLSGGRSTFMVEMTEMADILARATQDSLLILDEIGRGTSTFDGMAVARAVLEWVANPKRLAARTLFATHYHELTALENDLPGVRNYNVTVKRRDGKVIFLRRVVPGGADDSFGVDVAAMAGLPGPVIARAREILADLENGSRGGVPSPPAVGRNDPGAPCIQQDGQFTLGDLRGGQLINELEKLDADTLTPLEALALIYKWKKEAAP